MTLALARRPAVRAVRPRATARPQRPGVARRIITPRRPAHAAPARRAPAWEVRSFAIVASLIALTFAVAVLYLTQTTAVAAGGYEAQRLADVRDELRRQNSLLEVQIARLDSPARIETDALKQGLVRAKSVPIVSAETLAARR